MKNEIKEGSKVMYDGRLRNVCAVYDENTISLSLIGHDDVECDWTIHKNECISVEKVLIFRKSKDKFIETYEPKDGDMFLNECGESECISIFTFNTEPYCCHSIYKGYDKKAVELFKKRDNFFFLFTIAGKDRKFFLSCTFRNRGTRKSIRLNGYVREKLIGNGLVFVFRGKGVKIHEVPISYISDIKYNNHSSTIENEVPITFDFIYK